jgi:ComF family protein
MGVIDIFFPKRCFGCGHSGIYICNSCLKKVEPSRLTCVYCGKRAVDGMTHTKCKKKLGLDSLLSIWRYSGIVRKAILDLKFKFATDVIEELSDKLFLEIKKRKFVFPNNVVLVPIPLHKRRKNWRGFNQVEEVGKLLAKKMDWKYTDNLLVRKYSKTPQSKLKRDERKANIQGVFSLNLKIRIPTANYKILLFDDVFTTGSTIKEAAKVLKRGGFNQVWGLTIAR